MPSCQLLPPSKPSSRCPCHPMDCGLCLCSIVVVLVTVTVLIHKDMITGNYVDAATDVFDLWPAARRDATAVTWAHAANSRERLDRAIDDGEGLN